MKTSKVIEGAIKLIENFGWTKKAFARDKYRHKVELNSDRACKFCVSGAIRKAGGKNEELDKVNNYLNTFYSFLSIPAWNDAPETKKKDVINFLYRAKNHFKKIGD